MSENAYIVLLATLQLIIHIKDWYRSREVPRFRRVVVTQKGFAISETQKQFQEIRYIATYVLTHAFIIV